MPYELQVRFDDFVREKQKERDCNAASEERPARYALQLSGQGDHANWLGGKQDLN